MKRTRMRPGPACRMRPAEALALGLVLSFFGIGYLALACNALSAVLAAITIIIYIFGYTPLKRASTADTGVCGPPGRDPASDWLGGGPRSARRWRMEPFRNSFAMAIAAFLRDCVDV